MKKEINYSGETRFKQAHLNYFATKWKRLDVRGKSSKELKDIINELHKCNRYLLRCIKSLDYKESEARKAGTAGKQAQKQADHKLITKAKRAERVIARQNARKLVVEAKSVLQSKISDLLSNIRQLRNRIAKGLMRERSLRAEISSLKKQLESKPDKQLASQFFIDLANEYKDKYDKEKIRANRNLMKKQRQKIVKKEVVVAVEKPRSLEEIKALKFKQYVDQPIDKRMVNTSDIALKTILFFKDSDLTLDEMQILFKGVLIGTFTSKQIELKPRVLAKLERKGYLSRDKTGIANASHYWFLTISGEKIVSDFKNYLSYGKTKL